LLDAGCSLPVAKYWILVAGSLILDVSIEDFQIFAPVKMVLLNLKGQNVGKALMGDVCAELAQPPGVMV